MKQQMIKFALLLSILKTFGSEKANDIDLSHVWVNQECYNEIRSKRSISIFSKYSDPVYLSINPEQFVYYDESEKDRIPDSTDIMVIYGINNAQFYKLLKNNKSRILVLSDAIQQSGNKDSLTIQPINDTTILIGTKPYIKTEIDDINYVDNMLILSRRYRKGSTFVEFSKEGFVKGFQNYRRYSILFENGIDLLRGA